MLPEEVEQLSLVISSMRRNPTQTMHFNMTWENYGSQNGLAFHPGLHASPCLSWLPRTSVPYYIPCLRKIYICLKELAGAQISETAMSRQFANRMWSCQRSLLLPTLESPYPWAAEVRFAAWRPGLPWVGPRTEAGGQRNTQKRLYLIHTLALAHRAQSIKFTAGMSNGCHASLDTCSTLHRVFRRIVEYPANESQRNIQTIDQFI